MLRFLFLFGYSFVFFFFTLWQSIFLLVFMSNDVPSSAIPVLHFKVTPEGGFPAVSAAGGNAAVPVLQKTISM